MKKIKSGIACLVLGMSISTICAASNNHNKHHQTNQSTSTEVESSTMLSDSDAKEIELLKQAKDIDVFNLVIQVVQSELPSIKKQYVGGLVKDISITGKPDHTIVYTYTLTQSSMGSLNMQAVKPVVIKLFKPIIDKVKVLIPDVKFQLVYLGSDGTELGNLVITQTDTDNIDTKSAGAIKSIDNWGSVDDKFNVMIEVAQSQIASFKQQYSSFYQDVALTGKANHTIVYQFRLKKPMSAEEKKNLKQQTIKPFIAGMIKPIMDGVKQLVPDVKIQIIYLDANGSKLFDFMLTQADIEKSSAQLPENVKAMVSEGHVDIFNLMVAGSQIQIPELKKRARDVFSDVTITGTPDHTVVYTFVFRNPVPAIDPIEFKTILKRKLAKELKPEFNKMKVFVPDVKIKVVFSNPDGSTWADILITSEDMAATE